jgi:hypothetical protein
MARLRHVRVFTGRFAGEMPLHVFNERPPSSFLLYLPQPLLEFSSTLLYPQTTVSPAIRIVTHDALGRVVIS